MTMKTTKRATPRKPLPAAPRFTLWLDPDVIAHFHRDERGWQSRINAALRKAAKLPREKRKKA